MNEDPLVSVLMTAYNREKYIAEAIESVLHSGYSNFELIIVDDGSVDNTLEIANTYASKDQRIKVFVNEQNLGDYPNRNTAARHASGKYLKYVDSDDSVYPYTLAIMVKAMEKHPTAAFGFCDAKPSEKKEYPIFYRGDEALKQHFFNKGMLLMGPTSTIIRKEAFTAIGGFPNERYIGDYKAWLMFCLQYDTIVLRPGLVWVRAHTGQEFDVGKLEYYHLNYNLHKSFINGPDSPFTEEEKKTLLFNYRILLGRRVYQRLIKWYGLKKSLQTIRKAGETPLILLTAFLPMKKNKCFIL